MVGLVGARTTQDADAFAEHWDGRTWRSEPGAVPPSPGGFTNSQFDAVSCPTTRMCMATGYTGNLPGDGFAEIWHVGRGWSLTRTPRPAGRSALTGVSCVSPTQCVAVGFRGPVMFPARARPLVEAWNGAAWRIGSVPGALGFLPESVSCGSARACVAVGSIDGVSAALVERGAVWSLVPVATVPTIPPERLSVLVTLSSISCPTTATCTAVVYSSSSECF